MLREHIAPILASLLISSPGIAFAETFHVAPTGDDNNPGSALAPWETIAKANSTLQPGDTVLLHAGTYDEQIRPINDGTNNEQRIVYRAFGDGDVLLTSFPSAGGPGDGALALGERRYVTVSGGAAGDPIESQRIRLLPLVDISLLGNVCGSEGVVVENIYAECPNNDQNCNRGFAFCLNFWSGEYETRYNVLRNSTLIGNSDPGEDPNDFTEDLLTIAHQAHHNVIENNLISTCRHSSLYADSPTSHSNVIRGNTILNPQHTALSIWSAGVSLTPGARFLVENNWLSASGTTTNPDGFPGNALQWGSDELIIRHNVITKGGSASDQSTSIGGLMGATSTTFETPYFATDGRVYNNSIVNNRGAAVGMFDFGVDPIDLGRHVFVNNIFYGSESAQTGDLLAVYWDGFFATSDRYVRNVWGNPLGSPSHAILSNAHHGTADLAVAVEQWRNPEDPELTSWFGFENAYDAEPGFVDFGAEKYRLEPSSPYIDSAAPLTRVAAGDTGNGSQMLVEDARFFFAEATEFPAWMGVEPEWIAVGADFATAPRVHIAAVDDASGLLTLEGPLVRNPGDFVWLWSDSTGRQTVHGPGPDLGAFEFTPVLFRDGFESGDLSAWSSSTSRAALR